MGYWGYGKTFNPQYHTFPHMKPSEQKVYLEKKERKFKMARDHAEKLAEIAMNVMTLKGKGYVNEEDA